MVEKFRELSSAVEATGQQPLRLLTDVSGEHFWTVVIEAQVERVEQFFEMEQQLVEDGTLPRIMADYHELVQSGRREIYRIED